MDLLFRASSPFLCAFRLVSKKRLLKKTMSEKRKEETKEKETKKRGEEVLVAC
jgi:hypothetical protein